MSFSHITRRGPGEYSPKPVGRYESAPRGIENDEAMELFLKYKETGDYNYRNKILQGCLRRIHWAVSQMCDGDTVALEDLIQESTIWFLKGIDEYNLDKATTPRGTIKICNFCLTYVRKAVYEYYEKNEHNIRIPAPVKRALSKERKLLNEVIKEYDTDNISPDMLFANSDQFVRQGVATFYSRKNIVDPMDAEHSIIGSQAQPSDDWRQVIKMVYELDADTKNIILAYYGWGDDSVVDYEYSRRNKASSKPRIDGFSNAMSFERACFKANVDSFTGKKRVEDALNRIRIELRLPSKEVRTINFEPQSAGEIPTRQSTLFG